MSRAAENLAGVHYGDLHKFKTSAGFSLIVIGVIGLLGYLSLVHALGERVNLWHLLVPILTAGIGGYILRESISDWAKIQDELDEQTMQQTTLNELQIELRQHKKHLWRLEGRLIEQDESTSQMKTRDGFTYSFDTTVEDLE